jgi:TPR repeat protein
MNNLGHMYEHGQGVAQDNDQARQWYEKAVAGGNASAKASLERLSQ